MEDRSKEEVARDVEQTRAEAKRAVRNAGEVWSGQNAVASAWRSTKGTYFRAHDKVLDGAYAVDDTVHENIYAAIGIALGLGALVGYFATSKPLRRKRKNR